jgi:hypothetical protein
MRALQIHVKAGNFVTLLFFLGKVLTRPLRAGSARLTRRRARTRHTNDAPS